VKIATGFLVLAGYAYPLAGGAEPKLWLNWPRICLRHGLANLTPVPPLHPMERGLGGEVARASWPHPPFPLSIRWRGGQGERSHAPAHEKSAQADNNLGDSN